MRLGPLVPFALLTFAACNTVPTNSSSPARTESANGTGSRRPNAESPQPQGEVRSTEPEVAGARRAAGADAGREATGTGSRRPNVVVIFIDDMGYADIGPFGGSFPTPNLDRMAQEGMRFTDFAVSSAVCSASRAALLTGCYHQRIGIAGALGPDAQIGLAAGETTLAELCRDRGYATACFGKWHLGHHPKFLPTRHGFDEWFGLPYSNDMWPLHPNFAHLPKDAEARKRGYPALPLLDGERVVDAEVTGEDQALLTRTYTDRAVDFIERNRAKPFFLYVPHTMVHVPLFVSPEFAGKSGKGLFGDAVLEIDWSVGRILDTLRRLELANDTLVLFTSDNGPWLPYGEHAGSAGPLREGKGTMFEGGIRTPTIAWWPGKVPAGATCAEFASTIDVLPTIAKVVGAPLPKRKIDGLDITPLLFGEPGALSPHELFCCYYAGGQLQAVRDARWKLHFPHGYPSLAGKPGGRAGSPAPQVTLQIGLALYDLRADPGETTDVAAANRDVVERLQRLADAARTDLGDTLTKTTGTGVRPADRLAEGDERLRW
ncbi:MAG: sulfatase [Planctomycetes bacterium]|nr:sulfatase [Planctomycetota bacterium]